MNKYNDYLKGHSKPVYTAGGLGDILKPLLQIIRLVKPEREPFFWRLLRQIESEKLIEKADSLEAQILAVVIGLKDQVERGRLPVKKITDAFNEGRPEKSRVSYQKIGRRLSAMGFRKARGGDGAFAIIWDEESVERMMGMYGLRETPETSAPDPNVSERAIDPPGPPGRRPSGVGDRMALWAGGPTPPTTFQAQMSWPPLPCIDCGALTSNPYRCPQCIELAKQKLMEDRT